jgi:SPP1 family predicted phage head-tail adaptor
MKMYAAKMRHRIRIEKPTDQVDGFGHRLKDWVEVATVSAEVRPVGSNERLIAFQMQSGQTHVITARWSEALAAVSGDCRIMFQDRLFNIIGRPRNVTEKNRFIVFDTREGNADAH